MIENEFAEYLILPGTFWDLKIHHSQNLLGKCLLWFKGKDKDLLELTMEEQEEFWKLSTIAKKALSNLFNPDKYNYICAGNRTNHLHFHILPRYKEKRIFEEETFEDKEFGSFPTIETTTPEDTLFKIRDKMKEEIQKNL